jgi:hypothetical protein
MPLATQHQPRHNQAVPFNSGTGIGVPFDIGGQPPSGYFYVRSLPLVRFPLWAGRGRSVLARAGSYVPVRQSCYVLAHPRLASGGLVNTRHRRQTMPSSIALRVIYAITPVSIARRLAYRAYLRGNISAVSLVRMIGGAA